MSAVPYDIIAPDTGTLVLVIFGALTLVQAPAIFKFLVSCLALLIPIPSALIRMRKIQQETLPPL